METNEKEAALGILLPQPFNFLASLINGNIAPEIREKNQ